MKEIEDVSQEPLIAVIDYGVGNSQSVVNALTFLGARAILTHDAVDIDRAHAYVMPGVGAFPEAMRNLEQLKLISILERNVLHLKKPLLGICLGMQLLAESSEEKGFHKGLGWIEGQIIHIGDRGDLRVPHVGWNHLDACQMKPLFCLTANNHCFFFDHSYHFTGPEEVISARCEYGGPLNVAIQQNNIMGVQFHPEKSQRNGLKLFRCYLNYIADFIAHREGLHHVA